MAAEISDSHGIPEATADVSVPDLGIDPGECLTPERSDPCTIVIFGATGDLTALKLIPALFDLYLHEALPEPFLIVGCGRTPLDDVEFRGMMRDALQEAGLLKKTRWSEFAAALHYSVIDYTCPESFQGLASRLRNLDQQYQTRGNWIFYIALPPSLYKPVAELLGQAGLAAEGEHGNGWSRIVVEKPFGTDLDTAVDLDERLHVYFREHQIYRIDHYLAKETVQNLLMFRFANALFEPLWNRRYVSHMHITATETVGVEHRAGYYEQAGVIRDMFQNHMMQL
ncbi:MAG: glucose-6-phosphate dehydrogenase (NADP(+)), partial [Desulfobacterales bacterium]